MSDSKQPVTIKVNYNELMQKLKDEPLENKTWIFKIADITGFNVETTDAPMGNLAQLEDFINTPNLEIADIPKLKKIYTWLRISISYDSDKHYKVNAPRYFKVKEYGFAIPKFDITMDAATEAKFVEMTKTLAFDNIISLLGDSISAYQKWASTKTLLYDVTPPSSITFKHQYTNYCIHDEALTDFIIANNIDLDDLVDGYLNNCLDTTKKAIIAVMAKRYRSHAPLIKELNQLCEKLE